MITLQSVSKIYGAAKGRRQALGSISATFEPNQHVVVLGVRGSGKTTLLRIISGMVPPTAGSVWRRGTVSIPVGAAASLALSKTARELAVFLASIYEVSAKEVVKFVAAFDKLEAIIDLPVQSLPTSTRVMLSYALGYAIPCDYYLFDDNVTYGHEPTRSFWLKAFESRRRSAGTIVTTRDLRRAEALGETGAVLHGGQLYMFPSVREAMETYRELDLASQTPGHAHARALVIKEGAREAHTYLKRHLERSEDSPASYELFAQLALRLGNHSDAATGALAAMNRGSTSVDMHLILAKVAAHKTDYVEAIRHAEAALKVAPENREASVLKARCLDGLRDHSDAASIWMRLEDRGAALNSYIRAEKWDSVLSTVDAMLADRPTDLRLLGYRARALIELQHWAQVPEAIAQIVAVQPEEALNLLYRVARGGDAKSIAIALSGFSRLDFALYRKARVVDFTLRLLERSAFAATVMGNLGEAEEWRSLIEAIDPERAIARQKAATSDASVPRNDEPVRGEAIAGKRTLLTAEEIVRELYELRVERPKVESKEFDARNRAVWEAAKQLLEGKRVDSTESGQGAADVSTGSTSESNTPDHKNW
jgi:capsular polysaccharide transport system ATP-binding protein